MSDRLRKAVASLKECEAREGKECEACRHEVVKAAIEAMEVENV